MFNFNWTGFNTNLVIFILIIWEAFWKATALWKSAKAGDKLWFVAIFVINFFGIIPIVYLWRTKQLKEVLQNIKNFLKLR